MKTKRIASFLLVCLLTAGMLSFSSVSANSIRQDGKILEIIPIMPTWTHTTRIISDVTFSGRTATCTGSISALTGATISATLTLYKQNGSSWDYVTSWSKTSSTAFLSFNETHTVNSAGTYRTVISGTVTRNGTSENVSAASTNKTVG